MGAPIILGTLSAVGLSWIRRDAILWPLMFLSIGVALWGLARDRQRHNRTGPPALAVAGAAALVAGVVFVHGPPARLPIYGGAVGLVAATGWNVWTRSTR